ncbi:class II aldolase/adducin family protein [Pseudomonas sp. Marseille-Q8238]
MSITLSDLTPHAREFVEKAIAEATLAFDVFRETNTITANGTVGFVERIPGEDLLVSINYPGPFRRNEPARYSFSVLSGPGRYNKLFQEFPEVTTISHVHTPSLGAWAQTHRTLPIRYVPVQRYKLFRELPIYIDRRQQEVDFIIDQVRLNPQVKAILEANGGATVWGSQGLRETAEFIQILEEGASIQIAAEAIGGSRDFGPGVLAQQFKMSGLTEQAKELGLLPITDR